MDIKFTVFATGPGVVNNYLIYRALKPGPPPGPVEAVQVDPPVQSFPKQLHLDVPEPVIHLVEIWSSPDGVALGTLLHNFLYDPTFETVEIRLALELRVDGGGPYDPNTGDITFPDIDGSDPAFPDISTWEGVAQWWPEMRSKGGKLAKSEYTINSGNRSFTLTGGDQFYEGDYIFICFPPKITLQNPTFINSNLYTGRLLVTDSIAVDNTFYNKYVDVVLAASNGVIDLEAASNVADDKLLSIFNMNGAQKEITIRCNGAEQILWNGLLFSEIWLRKTEYVTLFKFTDMTDPDNPVAKYAVANELSGMKDVGKRVYMDFGLLEDPLNPNVSAADGGALPVADHKRVLWMINRMPPGQVITKAARDAGGVTLAGMWAVDNAGAPTIIYKPDLRGAHDRAIPGTRTGMDSQRNSASRAGSYGADDIKSHKHMTVVDQGFDTGSFPDQIGRAITALRAVIKRWSKTTGNGKESTWLAGSAADTDVPTIGPTSSAGGTENLVKTYGVVIGYHL